MNTYILPYALGSSSAKVLASGLGIKRVDGSKTFKRGTIIINWGNSHLPLHGRFLPRVLNKPEAVARAIDKLTTFSVLTQHGVSVPDWTTNPVVAQSWVTEESYVYARTISNGSQGDGIKVLTMDEQWVYAPLYTKAIHKAHEYRVHVFKGRVIDFTKKKRRSETECNPYIKNASGGWVFTRENIILPEIVRQESIKAVSALGLDFGALDVAYKERDDKVYILECNTSPGLEGTTLEKYIEAFKGEGLC
jgi:hypothetical protein